MKEKGREGEFGKGRGEIRRGEGKGKLGEGRKRRGRKGEVLKKREGGNWQGE